ncbi:arsenosugar biosynthesis radical SAM (seleno)protein ArsS [Peijinzhouia sedimentorum]
MKSLNALGHRLSHAERQIEILENEAENQQPFFEDKLEIIGMSPLKATGIEIMQVNMGKMCNQVCKHCHVDAGPDRKEIMTQATMQSILDVLKTTDIQTVDLTGGAPEMNPNFRWFVEEISKLGRHIIVRCNLTIILANPKYHDLPQFFKKHRVEVVSSLPFYTSSRTDRQRGDGVFNKSIDALKLLNEVGYGKSDSGLILNLVYNPAGAFLPPSQEALEKEFKTALKKDFNIEFNSLFAITNLPISRFLDYLVNSGNYESYMQELVDAFNPAAAVSVMCRNTLSIGWDGFLYDCDFNQMLDLKVSQSKSQHISEFDLDALNKREIIVGRHCFGCTAGNGSSCGGSVA